MRGIIVGFVLLVAVSASAQSVYFPGSVYTMNGTLSPAEPGNKVSSTQIQQGIAAHGLELFATLTAQSDTARYDWNRRLAQGVGLRYSLAAPKGVVRVGVAYVSEQRFVFPRRINGLTFTMDAWFGWQQTAPQPRPVTQ